MINQITDLSIWCKADAIVLTVSSMFGSVLPRLADHDEQNGKIFQVSSLKQKNTVHRLGQVNKFIKSLNKRMAEKQLPLDLI